MDENAPVTTTQDVIQIPSVPPIQQVASAKEPKPKAFKTISILFYSFAIFYSILAIKAFGIVYILSSFDYSIGLFPFSTLKHIPFMPLVPIFYAIFGLLYLYLGIKIRSGTKTYYNKGLILLIVSVVLANIVVILALLYTQNIMNTVNNY